VIRAVLFDFDGVLANSEPLHCRAFQDVLRSVSLDLTEREYYSRYLGYDDVGAFQAIAADRGVTLTSGQMTELVARKAVRLEALEEGISVLFPGAREAVLRMAARGPVAIVSGARRAEIERTLEREGLRTHFPVLVAAEDTPVSKPDPAPYRLGIELLRARDGRLVSSDCLAVEDSRWGLASAIGAGLRTIAVTHSYPADALREADAIIDHLDALTEERLVALTR
jgi:beta-phosphoglucomutase